jgi:phenol 2-monooxygenase (NADPH)
MRFHSAPVLRLADAKPVHLGHVARANGAWRVARGAWRVYIFADHNEPTGASSRAGELCEFLGSEASPIKRFTQAGADPDSVIDVRAIFQQGHRELALDKMPLVLLPRKGKFGLIDYEKMFCPDPNADDIVKLRGVNRETGCMVVVRPDQYVSAVLPLHEHQALADFFAGILIDAKEGPHVSVLPSSSAAAAGRWSTPQ